MGIEYKDINEWEVETPNGWKSFAGIKKVDKNKYVRLIFDNNKSFNCSIGHKLKRKDGTLIDTKSIRKGTQILGKNNTLYTVISKEILHENIDLFDLIEVEDGHIYFTDEYISSNCAFIEGIEDIWLSAQYTLSCVDKHQLILTNKGLLRFDDIINKDIKIGFNDITPISLPNKNSENDICEKLYKSEKSDLYKVNFKSGNVIIGNKIHPLFTKNGWKTIGDITQNDSVLTLYNHNKFGNDIDYSDIDKLNILKNFNKNELSYLYGLFSSHGSFVKNSIQIKNKYKQITKKLLQFGFKQSNDLYFISDSISLKKLFKWIGFNKKIAVKQVPSKILSSSKKEQISYLQGVFDISTTIDKFGNITLISDSNRFALDIRSMLLNFGIYSEIRYSKSKKSSYTFNVYIKNSDAAKFYKEIGFVLKIKQTKEKFVSTESINIPNDKIENLYDDSLYQYWDKIQSIEFHKHDYSYDLKVNDNESFICEGLLNHNTGGRSVILSTPNGVGGFFHKTWVEAEEGKNKFNTIRLPWYLHPDRDQTWRDKQTQLSGPKGASQECDCEFSTSGDQVISIDILDYQKTSNIIDPIEKRGVDKDYWIFKQSNYSKEYIVSADCARGDGADFSAFQIIDIETLEQVAEYKGKLTTKDYGNLLITAATEYNNALLVVENTNVGWATIQQILDRGYDNLFYNEMDMNIVETDRSFSNKLNAINKKSVPGFSTTSKSRPLIINKMETYFNEKTFIMHSQRLYDELTVFIWNGAKAEAMKGYNDDLVMSLAIGLWIRDTALRIRTERTSYTKGMLTGIKRSAPTGITTQAIHQNAEDSWNFKVDPSKNDDLKWLL